MSFHSWMRRSLVLGLAGLALTVSILPVGAQGREDDFQREMIEKELAHWKPGKQNQAVPTRQLACVVGDPSGVWLSDEGSKIKLFPLGHNQYRVLFATRGCLGNWTLERTATYGNGILLLNRPVMEYCPATYNRLFTIRTPQGIRLISDDALAFHYKYKQKDTWFMAFENTTHTVKEVLPTAKPQARPL